MIEGRNELRGDNQNYMDEIEAFPDEELDDRIKEMERRVAAMEDVSKFDPEEAKRRYEADHPAAVKDVERARAMAKAGDFYETLAADALLAAKEKLGHLYKKADGIEEEAGKQPSISVEEQTFREDRIKELDQFKADRGR